MSAAPRGLSRPHASFIGTVCQGIHHCALHNDPPTSPKAQGDGRREHTTKNTTNVSNWNTRLSDHHTHQPHPFEGHGRHETNERTHTPHHKGGMRPGRTNHNGPMRLGSFTVRTPTTPPKGMAVARVHSPVLKPPPHHKPRTTPQASRKTHGRGTPTPTGAWRSGDPTACTTPQPGHQDRQILDLFHTSTGRPPPTRRETGHPTNGRHTGAPQNSVERR